MGLNVAPSFRVIADSQDVTDKIRERFRSLRLTDEAGVTSDTVEISLADNVPSVPLQVPPTGAELEIFIGYDGNVTRKGMFIVDEVELSGFPGEMTIRAKAAPFEGTKAGKVDLQSQKTRSWPKGTTLGAVVRRIAGEHRMTPAIASKLAGIALPHTDQAHESDMNFLSRLAKRYDAIAKPAGGRLVFTPRGEAETVGGAHMPRVTLTPKDGGRYRVTMKSRDGAGMVVGYYRDLGAAAHHEVTVGSGEPVKRIRHAFKDKATADAAIRAELRKRARGERSLSYTLPGRPELAAEVLVTMQDFRAGVDGEWLVKRAEHLIGPNGFTTSIECEIPNSAASVAKASGGASEDQVKGATVVD